MGGRSRSSSKTTTTTQNYNTYNTYNTNKGNLDNVQDFDGLLGRPTLNYGYIGGSKDIRQTPSTSLTPKTSNAAETRTANESRASSSAKAEGASITGLPNLGSAVGGAIGAAGNAGSVLGTLGGLAGMGANLYGATRRPQISNTQDYIPASNVSGGGYSESGGLFKNPLVIGAVALVSLAAVMALKRG